MKQEASKRKRIIPTNEYVIKKKQNSNIICCLV